MTGAGPPTLHALHPSVSATRLAARSTLREIAPGAVVLVACSGGADSLALAAAVAAEAPTLGVRAGAVVVDHGLQVDSGAVAHQAAAQCRLVGLDPVHVIRVRVTATAGGPEADARAARYAAFADAAEQSGAQAVLLAHTRHDQAEQVLLGLARGSGPRSLSGMPRRRDLVIRPFLHLGRDDTLAACAAFGLEPWHDPHNEDSSYRRVRARRLVALLEEELGPGIATALARSADLIRVDADYLDELATAELAALPEGPIAVATLGALPRPLRTRVWRALAIRAGVPAGSLTALHVESLDTLVTAWHGQGPLHLPGGVRASRGQTGINGEFVTIAVPGPVE